MSYTKCHFIVLLFLFLTLGGKAAVKGNKVLVISSYGTDYNWSNDIIDGINIEMRKNHPELELNVEYLASERFVQPEMWTERMSLLIDSYENNLPLAIVLISDEAWMAYRAAELHVFKDIPLFLCAVKPHSIDIQSYSENLMNLTLDMFTPTIESIKSYNATAVLREMNIPGYVHLMQKVVKGLDGFALITDNRFYGVYNRLLFEKYMAEKHPEYPIKYLDARFINSDTLLQHLPKISPQTGVLLSSWLTGLHGYTYSKNYIYSQMAYVLKAPIFMTNDLGLDKGYFLGGYFNESQFWGRKVSLMLNAVLSGASPKTIIPLVYKDEECRINWDVAEHFMLTKMVLPEDTIYINRSTPVFVKYRNYIISVAILFLVVLSSYLYSLNSNRKLRKSQKINQQLIEEAEVANQNLRQVRERLVEALNKAEEADRLKSSFVANMGNEIRTPLSAIVGFASLVVSMDSREDRDEAATHIKQNSDNLLHLVDSILDLSQLESGYVNLSLSEVSLYGLCADLVNSRQSLCKEGVSLNLVVSPENQNLTIVTDAHRLVQIISILLSNAMTFTNEGAIELGYFSYDDRSVEIYVKDTGIGIPDNKLDIIFDRFVKLDKYTVGAGMGLAVAERIVDIFGGEIGVSSQLGTGSKFWFRILKGDE